MRPISTSFSFPPITYHSCAKNFDSFSSWSSNALNLARSSPDNTSPTELYQATVVSIHHIVPLSISLSSNALWQQARGYFSTQIWFHFRALLAHPLTFLDSMAFWVRRIFVLRGDAPPSSTLVWHSMTEAMRAVVAEGSGGRVANKLEKAYLGLPEIRQAIDSVMLHNISIEVAEQHMAIWCMIRKSSNN